MRMDALSDSKIRAWTSLATVSRLVLERIERDLKAAGLPPLAWYDALLEVERTGEDGIRPMALQARLLLPQYGTSRLLERIATEGLVERRPAPGDGRGQIVAITENGKAMRRRMWPVYARALSFTVGNALSEDEAAQLVRLLGRIGDAAREN